jgi:hypothetical protein
MLIFVTLRFVSLNEERTKMLPVLKTVTKAVLAVKTKKRYLQSHKCLKTKRT